MRVTAAVYSNNLPVSEEQAQALAVNEALREPLSDFLDRQVRHRKLVAGVGIGLIVLGLMLIAVSLTAGIIGILAGLAVGGGGYYYIQNQRPPVQITGIEKRYWTGYSLPGEDGVVFYDATATVPDTEFKLEQLQNETKIREASAKLDELDDFPVLMNDDDNAEQEFIETLETIESELVGAETRTVNAPVFTQDSPETEAITRLVDHADAQPVPVRTEVDVEKAQQDLEALSELGNLAEDNPVEDELETISDVGQGVANNLTAHQDDVVETLNDHIQTAADAFGIVSYNFYCPDCHEDDVVSELVVADGSESDAYCKTCRSYHSKDEAIPRHKIKDELVLPIWDQLWAEKADEKRKIYQDIEDQKHDLKEREYEQCREEIRTTTERIRDLRSKIRDLKTQAKAAEGAVDEIGDLMVKYERLNEQRKEKFSSEVEEAFREIDQETKEILEETRAEEQERLQQAEEEAEEKAEMLRIEERQRQAEMLAAQREIQENIAKAQMQHQEQLAHAEIDAERAMTEAQIDQQAEYQRKNWLLETRGGTSFSDTINRMKYGKDELLGASARSD